MKWSGLVMRRKVPSSIHWAMVSSYAFFVATSTPSTKKDCLLPLKTFSAWPRGLTHSSVMTLRSLRSAPSTVRKASTQVSRPWIGSRVSGSMGLMSKEVQSWPRWSLPKRSQVKASNTVDLPVPLSPSMTASPPSK